MSVWTESDSFLRQPKSDSVIFISTQTPLGFPFFWFYDMNCCPRREYLSQGFLKWNSSQGRQASKSVSDNGWGQQDEGGSANSSRSEINECELLGESSLMMMMNLLIVKTEIWLEGETMHKLPHFQGLSLICGHQTGRWWGRRSKHSLVSKSNPRSVFRTFFLHSCTQIL